MNEVKKVYDLYKLKDNVEIFAPEDYNRFSNEMREKVITWMKKTLR
jgi:hypothetical protein